MRIIEYWLRIVATSRAVQGRYIRDGRCINVAMIHTPRKLGPTMTLRDSILHHPTATSPVRIVIADIQRAQHFSRTNAFTSFVSASLADSQVVTN